MQGGITVRNAETQIVRLL